MSQSIDKYVDASRSLQGKSAEKGTHGKGGRFIFLLIG